MYGPTVAGCGAGSSLGVDESGTDDGKEDED